jgi:hypothetical protein
MNSIHVMLMYILIHLGLIFFLFPFDIIASTDQGHWFPIMIGIIIHFGSLVIYMRGLEFFPKKNIVGIYFGYGKGKAVLFLVPILVYLILVLLITTRAYSEIINIVFLAHTPLWAIIFLLLFVATYIALKGIETILRTGILLSILFLPIILFVFILSFQNVDWKYAIPIEPDFRVFTKPSYFESFFAFSGGFLFLGFVQPYFSYKRKNILLSACILIPFFLFAVYIPVLTFGQSTASTMFLPYVVVVDSLNINWLMFDRVTMFFLLSLIGFIMLYTSLVLWKAALIISSFVPKIKVNYLMILLSVAVFFFSFLIPNWKEVEKFFWWTSFLRLYILITIPLSIYLLGIRVKRKSNNDTY